MHMLQWVVSNVLIAALLAVGAALVEKLSMRPQIRHALWVLVLVKLVTPPLVQIPVAIPLFNASGKAAKQVDHTATDSASLALEPDDPTGTDSSPTGNDVTAATSQANTAAQDALLHPPSRAAGVLDFVAMYWALLLLGIWGTGSLGWLLLAGTRLMQFHALLRHAHPASEALLSEVREIASRFGLRQLPHVLVVNAQVPPLIWGFAIGRPTMVLPGGLLESLEPQQRLGLVTHELAHLARYDHWVRWFEFVVLGIYWWNPLAWWARSQIQQAEEECCDAWVLWAYPESARQYAQTLIDTVEYLADTADLQPDFATAFSHSESLKRRIEMIISDRSTATISWKVKVLLAVSAAMLFPLSVSVTHGKHSLEIEDVLDDSSGHIDKDVIDGQTAHNHSPTSHVSEQTATTNRHDWDHSADTATEVQDVKIEELDTDTQKEVLAAIISDWRQRRESVKNITCQVEDTVTIKCGARTFIAKVDFPDQAIPEIPADDYSYHRHALYVLDFAGGRARLETSDEMLLWIEFSNEYAGYEFRPLHEVQAFDGKSYQRYRPRKINNGRPLLPDNPFIDLFQCSHQSLSTFFLARDFPIVLAFAMLPNREMRPNEMALPDSLAADLKVYGAASFEGRRHILLRTTWRTQYSDYFYEYWVDPSRNSVIAKFRFVSNEKEAERIETKYSLQSGIWLPVHSRMDTFGDDDKLTERHDIGLVFSQLNSNLANVVFHYEEEPGMVVQDSMEKKVFRIDEDGSRMPFEARQR